MRQLHLLLIVIGLILLIGCGGLKSTPPPAPVVSVAVTPNTASVAAGATQQFSGAVSGSSNAAVTWSVSGAGCSGAACGTISSSGMYTAPVTVPSPATITVKATAVADPTKSASAALTIGPAALLSITVSPASISLAKGTKQQLTATGKYTDGTSPDLTNQVTWSASSAEVTIDAKGMATAVAISSNVTVKATSGSISGSTTVTVTAAALASITVSGVASTPLGLKQQFVATGTYTDASTQDITSSVVWASSKTTVASIDAAAMVTTLAQGDTLISATSGQITGSAALTVLPPALVSISVTPATVSIGINGTQQFTAKGTYTDASIQDLTSSATWSSTLPTAVSIDAGGLGTALAWNATPITLTAASGGITSAPAVFTVLNSCVTRNIDMKLLVVNNSTANAGAGYPGFGAIQQSLGYLGTPYDVLDAGTLAGGLTAERLSDGYCHGFYQGVIFAYGQDYSALSGKTVLDTYEKSYGVRQLTWYAYPGTDFGMSYSAVAAAPYTTNFTAAAAPEFPYANTTAPFAIDVANAYTYLANVAPAAGGSVAPLLQDAAGKVVSVIYKTPDGREILTQTFDSNPYLTHNLVLAYGLINWVTKGIFLGEHHVYMTPQIDDVFIDDSEWVAGTACTTPVDDPSLPVFRINAADVDALLTWQTTKQTSPMFTNFVLHFAFNGSGTTGDPASGGFSPDDLTAKLKSVQASFKWINHTWDHQNLDAVNASLTNTEITRNNTRATWLGLTTNYTAASMVTPDVSGLNNVNFLNQAVKNGVKYLVSDTSVTGKPNNGVNPSPNVGIVNSLNHGIYEVPRHPNNLFYNVNNPADWEAEYHCIYATQPPYSTYTAAQIVDDISRGYIINMLNGDMDPEMFHQPNLRAYDGVHSLLTDLLDATFTKYIDLVNLPVLSPTLDQLGVAMQNRNAYNQSKVAATLSGVGGTAPKINLTIPTTGVAATIPVTGLNSTGAELYGGRTVSHITMTPGQTLTLPLQ